MEIGLVVLWLATFLLLGGIALPLTAWLLPDTDYTGFAIPVALLVVTLVGHLVGHVAFGWPAAFAGVAVLGILSGLVAVRGDYQPDFTRVGEHTAVFATGFILIIVIRAFDPAAAPLPVTIGEKFLDFGLLATLERTNTLPPEDMWFAGETVTYHYGGHLLTSLLATLTGTAPRFAYNLGLAGFFATLLSTAYALAGSIAEPYQVSRRIAAGLGAFFVGIAANLETAARLLAWLFPENIATESVKLFGLDPAVAQWSPGDFYYFDASRVIPVFPNDPDSFAAATEFPLFAWLNGDLHAHMMSQPFLLLAAGVLCAYWRAETGHQRVVLVGVLPPLVGLIAMTNLWSLPTVLGLTLLAVLFVPETPTELLPSLPGSVSLSSLSSAGRERQNQVLEEGYRVVLAFAVTAAVLAGAILWTVPFWTEVVLSGPSRSFAFWGSWTPLGPLLIVHGAFLAAIAVYLSRRLASGRTSPAAVLAGGIGLLGLATLIGVPALGLTVPLIVAGWWLVRTRLDVGFESVLIVAGGGLVLLMELVTIEGERFNVVFKPSVHVRLFWAIATAVILPRLASGWPTIASDRKRKLRQRSGAVLAVVLVVITAPYAGFALAEHVATDRPTTDEHGLTLDATAYLDVHYPEEADAIRWLDSQAGQPTIISDTPAGYWWDYDRGEGASAPSSLTGIPTFAGWFHERQYRGDDVFQSRVDDVRTMYGGDPAEQARLLDEYDVEYIYVGPVERTADYGVTVDQLDAVTVEQSWESVTIYRVAQNKL